MASDRTLFSPPGRIGRGLKKSIAVGRRNWTFYGSDNGSHTAAVLTSLTATCKRLRIDPFAYLRDVFERISAHSASRLAELLPDQWQAARAADTS